MAERKKVEDMNYFELLAWLGIGSSHPGGFPATRRNLETLQIGGEDFILDAGCGSGLTACYLAKTIGCKIVGIDMNPQMIAKARLRAEKEGVSHLVDFQVADVYNLPFAVNYFDWVIAESLTVFLDKIKVYGEFYRVLKPQGRVADLEMVLLAELPPGLRTQMEDCFGPGTDPLTFAQWCESLIQAGFEDVEVKNPQRMQNNGKVLLNELKKDWVLLRSLAEKASELPALAKRLQKNAGFMKQNRGYFGFGLLCGSKPALPPPSPARGFKNWLGRLWQNVIRRHSRPPSG